MDADWNAGDARRLAILLAYEHGDLTHGQASKMLDKDLIAFREYRTRVLEILRRASVEWWREHLTTGQTW